MKTGKTQIAAMYVNCPECGESYDGTQDGSQHISIHNICVEQIGKPVTCQACGEQYRLPASLRRMLA
jgi:RNase P subunit RPR2